MLQRTSKHPPSRTRRAAPRLTKPRLPTSWLTPRSPLGRAAGSPVLAGSPATLFASLKLERTPDGGLRIDAPRGAVEQLMELFSDMAKLFAELSESSPDKEAP